MLHAGKPSWPLRWPWPGSSRTELPETLHAGARCNRARLLGAYAFAADVLTKLGADTVDDYCVATCTRFVCRDSAPQLQKCFLCRLTATWSSGRLLHQEPAAAQEPEPEEERQSSAKFHQLAGIIAGLGETKRVLVVLPLKALLNDAQAKIVKLGMTLAILQGGRPGAEGHVQELGARGVPGAAVRPRPPSAVAISA